MNDLTTFDLLKQLYIACKNFDAERMLVAAETLTTAGVSYRLQNKVMRLANSSNCIESIDNSISSILEIEPPIYFSCN